MLALSAILTDFRLFVKNHPELKKLAIAKVIGTSASGLSAILSNANKPTVEQTFRILNLLRGTSTRIVGLQENVDAASINGDPYPSRIELNAKNLEFLEKFNLKVDATLFSNGGRVAREGADPSEDPASGDGDPTAISNRKAGIEGTDDPSLDNLLGQLNDLYRIIGDVLAAKKAVPNKTGSTGRNTNQRF